MSLILCGHIEDTSTPRCSAWIWGGDKTSRDGGCRRICSGYYRTYSARLGDEKGYATCNQGSRRRRVVKGSLQ
jgi:hypothetical protein